MPVYERCLRRDAAPESLGVRAFAGPFAPRDLGLYRLLAFLLGFTLPILTLKTGYYGTPQDLLSRIAAADVLCLLIFGLLCLRGSPVRVPAAGWIYLFALVVALIPALLFWGGRESFVWTTFTGILMAFLFYLLGLSIGESTAVLSPLLWGLCLSTFGEFVVVTHDYFFSHQWFPDPMEGRARGTFKANGQLGAFGFCAAGMLLALAQVPRSRPLRITCAVTGLLSASMVFTASRRTGMICALLWAAAFAALGIRFARRRFYRIFLGSLVLSTVVATLSWSSLSQSFAGKRLNEGLSSLQSSDGFIRAQHENILRTALQWFPLGFGPGRGNRIDLADPEHHEIHNGLLAVLVELGVLGFLGFVGVVLRPLFRRKEGKGPEDRALRRTLITSFLLVSFVFMFHNTLYRDRTFLLYLGIVTTLVRRDDARPATPGGGLR